MKSAQMSEININDPMNSQDLSLSGREILIADAGVEDLDTLISGLNEGVEAWLVQPGQDAIGLIINAISSPNLKKLHMLAHGAPGEIHLGGSVITASDFRNRFDGAAERDLDIAFWSCHTGAGDVGQGFVQSVADATGARVSATDGLVGNAQKGGSWRLNVSAPFSAEAQDQFKSTLANIAGYRLLLGTQVSTHSTNLAGDTADLPMANQRIIIDASSVAAADLHTLHGLVAGTGSTINISAITSLTGTAAEVIALISDAKLTNKSAVPVTLDVDTPTAADLIAISAAFGVIDANAITAMTDTAAKIALVCADATIIHKTAINATISVGTISAKELKAISVAMGTVAFTTVASNTAVGSVAELAALAADSGTITAKTSLAVTVNAGVMTATQLIAISAAFGVVTIASTGTGTTISGTAADLSTVTLDTTIVNASKENATMIITGGAGVTAADLETLASQTGHSLVVNATAAGTLTGTVADILVVIGDSAITGKSALAVTLGGEVVTAANLKTISAGLGVINIAAATSITGSAADLAIIAADVGITGKSAVPVTIDAASYTAAQLIAISASMGAIGFASAGLGTTITGTSES